MVVLTKTEVRQRFAKRFREAGSRLEGAPKGRGLTAWLARELSLSGEMVRKYLAGESMPNQARMPVLAAKLRVTPAWLRSESENPDVLLAEFESLWQGISDDMAKTEIIEFARFKQSSTKKITPSKVNPRHRSTGL